MLSSVRFGIVGTNFISDWILDAAEEDPRFVAAAVCSRSREKGEEFARRHKIDVVYTSIEEMAESPLVDAVYIASPNSLHAQQSILCMQHGKHVLCEKPLASNSTEVRAMIRTARENGVVLMEAMKSTLTPNFLALKKNLDIAGRLRHYFAAYCQYSSRYDRLKEGKVTNVFNPKFAGGAMMDLGVYAIYPMVVLFGKPNKVVAMGRKLYTGVDGEGTVYFDYGNMSATVLYSKMVESSLPSEIQGEEGTFILNNIHTIAQMDFRACQGETYTMTQVRWHHEYYYEIAEMLNLITSGQMESEINSHAHSLAAMEIMDEVRYQLGIIYPADMVNRG